MKSKLLRPELCAALGNIIWGFGFLFTKLGLSNVPDPNIMLAHRFLLSTLCMALFIVTGKEKISFRGKNWKPITLLLLMQIIYYFFETNAVIHSSTTIAGLVLAVVPVAAIGTGALFLREYPTRRQLLFCILPVAGVIIMTVSGQELGAVTPLGVVFLFLTMLASALYKTANRKAALDFTPFERTIIVLATSAIAFTALAMNAVGWDIKAFAAPLLDWKYLLVVLCLSLLCSISANLLVNYASGKMSVFKVASFGSLSTLCSAVAGVVFLKESINLSLILGAVLILVGIRQVTNPK